MAAAAVDTAYLASFTTIPEPSLLNLIESPTPESVTAFLSTIITKAQENERLKSERLRLEVELENAVHEGERRARSLKATSDHLLHDIEDLRKKLGEEESKSSHLESQLQKAQSNTSNTSAQVESLRAQVARLEKSSRDTLALLDAKTTSHDKLADDLATQHQQTLELRRNISSLEDQKQTAESSLGAAKIRESNITSQVESLKRNNEWLDSELKTKAAEFTKYKKDKTAKISELQRLNDEATTKLDSSKRIEATLRKRLEEISQKADDGFSRIQQLQEEMARAEESSRLEIGSTQRLAELQQQSAETARRRVGELEHQLEQTKDDAADEIAQIQAELETEREGKEAAEQKVEQLEARVEQLESTSHIGILGTPRANGLSTPQRAGSPAVNTPASARSRGGLSMTQMYSEYNNTKAELEAEKRRNQKLSETIDEMLQDLEKKGPEVQELHMEHNRLQDEVNQFSDLLAEAGQEKEAARKDAKRWQGKVEGLLREAELNHQQLRDLSAQIKVLLVELQLRQDGSELSAAERLQLQQAAQGDDEALEGLTDTARFISQRLVSFKDIFELQEKNMELTRLTRELGERMESEEAREKEQAQSREHAELEELRERVERYKDEMKSLVTQSESFIRERDMFRRMLSHRGKLPPEADHVAMFGQSINGAPAAPSTPRIGTPGLQADQSPASRELADYAKLVKELQAHFDAYRKEAATDHSTLKAQVDQLAKEKSHLQGEIARAASQLTLARERYDMLQSNYAMLQNENNEIQKRSNSLAESAAKQDLRTQQVAEELVDSKSLNESLRNENANLKAEKNFWGQTETRLTSENQSLREETSRLNKIITDTQNLHNEQKLTDSEIRRKLQSQVESLDVESRTAKRKLEEEIEASRNAALRREYDQEQNRTRIDDLMKGLGNAKEELATVKTVRDQLQARSEELKIELSNAENRAKALQPRPTPRPESAAPANGESTNLEREQELGLEIADLKKELELVKAELENTKAQIEQYKAISQSAEEELQSINEAHDQFREDTDKIVAEKDAKIRDLEQRVEDISSELSETNNQLSELRTAAEDNNNRLEQQQALHEDEVTRIKDENERYRETANFYQQDLKAQAEIAKQAQMNYEEELVKHAEAAKTLQAVRSDYNSVRLEVSEAKADAEAARATLTQNEESWSSTREQYDREISELKIRSNDLSEQNKVLHKQLETVGAQITALQQERAKAGENLEEAQALADSSTQNLHEVIKYLRREKEIVDVQYELSVQEARRLRQQFDYSQTQLDDARLRLEQERQSQSEKEKSSISHSKLMETINELNVFRESSVTLRNEARQAQAQFGEKSRQVDELIGQIQPLQTSIRELENERDTKQGEIKLLEEDRNRWQQRTQTILQKYDRIDPAELEGLRDQIKKLEEERDSSVTAKDSLQQQVDTFDEKLQTAREQAKEETTASFQESRAKMVDQFKGRSRELSTRIKAGEAEVNALKTQLEATQTELEQVKAERDEAVAKANTASAHPSETTQDVVMQNSVEEGQISEDGPQVDGMGLQQQQQQQQRAEAAEAKLVEADTRITNLQDQASELQSQVNVLQERLEAANTELISQQQQQQQQQQAQNTNGAESNEVSAKAEEKLPAAQQELETDTNTANNGTSETASVPAPVAEEQRPDAEQIAAQVATIREELETAHTKRVAELEQQYQRRTEQMRRTLSNKLTEGKNSIREELGQQHAQAVEALKQEHERAVAELSSNHQKEIKNLQQSLLSSRQAASATGDADAPAQTPRTPVSTATAAPPATENAFNANSTPNVQVQSPLPPPTQGAAEYNPSPQQVRALIQSHPTAREIVSRNIRTKLEHEAVKIKEEAERNLTEMLEDAKQKAEKAKEQAVNMEGKKWTVKINMADNKARNASAKIEYVQKAATDTPQRPVVEVWNVAKDIKAPPVQSTGSAATANAAPGAQLIPPASSESSASVPPVASETASEFSQQQRRQQQQQQPQVNETPQTPAATPPNLPPAPIAAPTQLQSLPPLPQTNGPTQADFAATIPNVETHDNNDINAVSRQGAGTGPAALRGLMSQGSGIPRGGMNARASVRGGRGGAATHDGISNQQQQQQQQQQHAQRGTGGPGIPRGIGRGGRGRGGHGHGNGQFGSGLPQPLNTTTLEGASARGGMNAGAKQFVPGNKRPRQDSTGGAPGQDGAGAAGNIGKRIRGGAAGQ